MTSLFSGLYFEWVGSPTSLRNNEELKSLGIDVKVVFTSYQVLYNGTLICSVYKEQKMTKLEFFCIPKTHRVFRVINIVLETVLPKHKLVVEDEKWLIK